MIYPPRAAWPTLLCLLGLGTLRLIAESAAFAPPADGPLPFRRDQLSLDGDRLMELSGQLTQLASQTDFETAVGRRAAAQLLALALALDPANSQARQQLDSYQAGRRPEGGSSDHLDRDRAAIQSKLTWLGSPTAGPHAQALAECLSDVLGCLNKPEDWDENDERAAWAGWIPGLAAFQKASPAPPPAPAPVPVDPTPPVKTPEPAPNPESAIRLDRAELKALLWQSRGQQWRLEASSLKMTAGRHGENSDSSPLAIRIGPKYGPQGLGSTSQILTRLLRKRYPNLPSGHWIEITNRALEGSLPSGKVQSISAVAGVLASAALSGQTPDAIILGQIDDSGAFKLPTDFWSQLKALGKGRGQRLVLPAAASEILASYLALENPGFFLEYEILLANDFDQLLELSHGQAANPLAQASQQFRVVHDKSVGQDVRLYIANRFVKQRLEEILQLAPGHFSARMLLTQATGKRPTQIVRPVLAAELNEALQAMDWVIDGAKKHSFESSSGLSDKDIIRLGKSHDRCRELIQKTSRYAQKDDRDLIEASEKVLEALRGVEKASRTRGESYVVSNATRSALNLLLDQHRETSQLYSSVGNGN